MQAQDQIKEWCAKDGRKLGWIAAQVPVANSSLSRWMKGRVVPGQVYRHRLADITGLDDIRSETSWIKEGDLS